MKKIAYLMIFILLAILGCTEDMKGPLTSDRDAPQSLTNIKVENLPGGAKISYTLPNDDDLLYVIANYTLSTGVERQVKSSIFKNYLMLEGFSETKDYTVKLKAVDRSENYSSEVTVTINPLEAPIHSVLNTLDVMSTWGGAYCKLINELENEYIVYTLIKDSINGNWVEYDRVYTKAREREFYLRGFEPVPLELAFYLTDKWSNSSDTLFKTITPLYEVMFDKTLWKDLALPDDSNKPRWGARPLSQLWNTTDAVPWFQQDNRIYFTLPNWVTIDLGKKYIFGRFRLNHMNHNTVYAFGSYSPKVFELWVTNTPTTNWDDWTFMGEYESVRPSGLPVGAPLTEDDIAVNKQGEDFEFPLSDEGYRYMRFKVIQTWGGMLYWGAAQFTLWGQPAE